MPQTLTTQVPWTASQRYTPKWDLWINSFLHVAVMNVLNSLVTVELEATTRASKGQMVTESEGHAAFDKLEGNVRLLESLILDEWVANDEEWKRRDTKDVYKLFHAIWQLFARRGYLRLLPERTLAK